MTLGAVIGTFVLKIGTGAGWFLPSPTRAPSRPGSSSCSCSSQWSGCRHQQPRHVLVRRDPAGDRRPGEALSGGPGRLRHRPGCDDVGDLQLLVHPVPRGLRGHRHCVDRPMVCHLPHGLGAAPLPLRPSELQNTGRTSLYWRNGGVFWPAIVAQVIGMFAAISALSATFHLPQWLNLVTYHTRDAYGYGGDFERVASAWASGKAVYAIPRHAGRAQAGRRAGTFAGGGAAAGRVTGSVPVFDETPEPSGWKSGMEPSVQDQVGVVAQGLSHAPPSVIRVPMTTSSACMRRTSRRGGQQRGSGRDDVVDHRHPPASDGLDPGRVHAQPAGACPS